MRPSSLLVALLAAALAPHLAGQCAQVVTSLCDVPGIRGQVLASTWWDPDGAGPAAPRLVFAGDFLLAGSVQANDVVSFDPATGTWLPLPGLVDSDQLQTVGRALAVLANGDLVLGGSVLVAGSTTNSGVVRWTGSGWQPLSPAAQLGGSVNALLAEPNGDLVVGGAFQNIGMTSFGRIARWNGSSWSSLGTGFSQLGDNVQALARMPNGDVVATGSFLAAGGVPAARIARWNGTAWSALGPGLTSSAQTLLVLANGDLVAGGQFTVASGLPGAAQHLARWNGTSWTGFAGSTFLQFARSLLQLSSGELLVGCNQVGGSFVQRWNGATFAPYPGPVPGIAATGVANTMLQLPTGDVYVAGSILGDTTTAVANVLRSNGSTWQVLTSGLLAPIRAVCEAPGGDLYVACEALFTESGVWRRRNGVWTGLAGNFGTAFDLAMAPNGDLVAYSQGTGMARWNGVAWQTFNTGLSGVVEETRVEANGDVVCCGDFQVAGGARYGLSRWNGVSWVPFAPGFFGLLCFVRMPNGDYVGASNNQIARWNGSQWLPLGWPTSSVRTLAVSPSGALFAGGGFSVAGGIPAASVARWNGTIWQALDTGLPFSANGLTFLPDGDLLAVGSFDQAGTGSRRWNGTAWSTFGPPTMPDGIAMQLTTTGGVLLAGRFDPRPTDSTLEYLPTLRLLTTGCPATALATGGGCVGSSGPVVLESAALPWLGSTFRARASGLPAASLAIAAWGTAGLAAPLSSLLAVGQPNCDLLVAPDVFVAQVPTLGEVATSLPIPDDLGLLGVVLRHQVLPFEFGPTGDLVAVTSSNALVLTIGDL